MLYQYPTIIVDRFFKDPNAVRELALEQEFKYDSDGHFSGQRTDSLHITHNDFFKQVCDKVLHCLSVPFIGYEALAHFHITGSEFGNEGWVHTDGGLTSGSRLAAIVYLNPQCEDLDNGTSIFKLKKINRTHENVDLMRKSFINSVDNEKIKNLHNQSFNETAKIGGVFNRMVAYDASQFHAGAGYFGNSPETSRLTLLVFFYKIITRDGYTPLQRAELSGDI